MAAAWMIPARDLKPGQVGIAANGDIIRKVGPLSRLERTDAKGWTYTLAPDDSRYVFIGWDEGLKAIGRKGGMRSTQPMQHVGLQAVQQLPAA